MTLTLRGSYVAHRYITVRGFERFLDYKLSHFIKLDTKEKFDFVFSGNKTFFYVEVTEVVPIEKR